MPPLRHDPIVSLRNHQRVIFIKGLYRAWRDINLLYESYEKTGAIEHERIDTLLESQLRELKELAHVLYRIPDDVHIEHKRQRVFDRMLGEIWHEMDKARDNIRLIESYNKEVDAYRTSGDLMLEGLLQLDEQVVLTAKKELPALLSLVKDIVDKLIPLFEQILPLYKDNVVVLRTIYFDQNELNNILRRPSVEYFFPLIQGSLQDGYIALIGSLIHTKHLEQARAALDRVEASEARPLPPERLESLRNQLLAAGMESSDMGE